MEPPPLPPGSGFITASIDFVISQPEAAFSLFLRKAVRLLEPLYAYPEGIPSSLLLVGHVWAICLSLIIGLGFLAYLFGRLWGVGAQLPSVGHLAMFVILFYLVHFAFLAEPRFMAPMFPVALVVAVAGISGLTRQVLSATSLSTCGWAARRRGG